MTSFKDTLLRDAIPQKGTRIGPEDVECIKFVQWMREQTRANKLRCVWLHIANEGKRSYRQGSLQRAKGLCAGAADYLLLYDSGAMAIEFKSKIGRQTDTQRDFERWCKHEGIPYHLVRSAAEARQLVLDTTVLWGRD